MKRLFVLMAVLVLAVSCGNSPEASVSALGKFVDNVEAKGDSYTPEDWEEVNEKFEALVDSISENYDDMTDEEKAEAMKEIGRYSAIYTKMGMRTAVDEFQKAMQALNPFMEGFSSVFDE